MKSCPRCKSLVFDDMDTCFDCMYRFVLDVVSEEEALRSCEVDDKPTTSSPRAKHLHRAGKESSSPDSSPSSFLSPFSKGADFTVVQKTDQGATIVQRFLLHEGNRLTVGRSLKNDLVLKGPSVSRSHACFSMTEGLIFLEDVQSTNGTFLNGMKVQNKIAVSSGDKIIVCGVEIRIEAVSN